MTDIEHFYQHGWCVFNQDSALIEWIHQALPAARLAVTAGQNAQWLRHDGTWFAGVNALPNQPDGSINGSNEITGEAVEFIHQHIQSGQFNWDQAQISICYPGYPKPSSDESEAAFRYRIKRDAAHIDGLIRIGPDKRRYLMEHHSFILGIPMVDFSAEASPFVIWRGSHRIAMQRFKDIFYSHSPENWSSLDVTDQYQSLRQELFESCERVTLHCEPGQSFLVHRMALHGMAPWQQDAVSGPDGRMICYFRPEAEAPEHWLNAP